MLYLKQETTAFFKPFYENAGGDKIIFRYGLNAFETWSAEIHVIPSTPETWLAGAAYPTLITDLFVSYSAAELLCFVSQRRDYVCRYPEQQAFAALGLLPANAQVKDLKTLFPNARWHLLFGPDLLGKITDATVAAWFKGNAVSFKMIAGRLAARYRNRKFYFDADSFSLHRFELATGMRSAMRTHKPPNGYPSFTAFQKKNAYDP